MLGPIKIAEANAQSDFFKSSQAISKKIILIAAATFLFFTWQYQRGALYAYKMTLGISLVSFFCETLILRPKDPSIAKGSKDSSFAIYLIASKVAQIFITCLYAGNIKVIAIQEIAKKLIALNPEALITSLLIAPFSEEILFRGFLKERIEDIFYLVSQLKPLSSHTINHISNIAQAVIFGSMHIVFGQVIQLKDKIVVFLNTTLLGFASGALKNTHQNYWASIGLHFLNNFHSTLNLTLNPQS